MVTGATEGEQGNSSRIAIIDILCQTDSQGNDQCDNNVRVDNIEDSPCSHAMDVVLSCSGSNEQMSDNRAGKKE